MPLKPVGWKRTVTLLMIEALCDHLLLRFGPRRLHDNALGSRMPIRDYYLHNLSDFKSYHLVYVDESGCDKRVGFRRTGWAPIGKAPLQVTQFHRDQRYQILPAYAQDGIVLSRVFRGSTDATVFEGFLAELLLHCGR